jgi:hypothetical protein
MTCLHLAIRDFVFIWGLILCALGLSCLLVSIARGRAAHIGDELLEICKYDDEIVRLALSNIREEHALVLGRSNYRKRVARFHDSDATP